MPEIIGGNVPESNGQDVTECYGEKQLSDSNVVFHRFFCGRDGLPPLPNLALWRGTGIGGYKH